MVRHTQLAKELRSRQYIHANKLTSHQYYEKSSQTLSILTCTISRTHELQQNETINPLNKTYEEKLTILVKSSSVELIFQITGGKLK